MCYHFSPAHYYNFGVIRKHTSIFEPRSIRGAKEHQTNRVWGANLLTDNQLFKQIGNLVISAQAENIDRGACLHKRQAKVLSDHINVWLNHVIIDAICSILFFLKSLFVLYFNPYKLEVSCCPPCTMSCSSVQQLHFVKLYDLFCMRLLIWLTSSTKNGCPPICGALR